MLPGRRIKLTLILCSQLATSSNDEVPQQYQQTQPSTSTLATDANPDLKGPSLSDRITVPTLGDLSGDLTIPSAPEVLRVESARVERSAV
ncbi:hypothetical protein PTTG_28995 [Puccinia triticina 1-1 BBBD Race 1]|uniref:Secreted protein n=1 Tax=Puccinia triticina (isolate 1-1 / race 1 (BBBD)) TaxID=630390 RepID=A0A180G7M2_PUCT1|nr:hypothetical protein PTTG_28995 [Puccinia triticina 1-1 BBBD Race 1]